MPATLTSWRKLTAVGIPLNCIVLCWCRDEDDKCWLSSPVSFPDAIAAGNYAKDNNVQAAIIIPDVRELDAPDEPVKPEFRNRKSTKSYG